MFATTALLALIVPYSAALAPSGGCKAPSAALPVAPGGSKRFTLESPEPTRSGGTATRWYWLNVPKSYDASKPATLVFVFHGFYDNGHYEMFEDSIPSYVNDNNKNVVSVYPIGALDDGGQSASWNIEGGGLNTSPGPNGPICGTPRRGSEMYTCYDSCSRSKQGCDPHHGCDASSCMDDRTFIKKLLQHVTDSVCVDLDRVHLTGISMGGQMVLQVALDLHAQIASIAPVAGARYWGYLRAPASPVPLLDVHGHADRTIPANQTRFAGPEGAAVSSDYFYYHTVPENTKAFAQANGCDVHKAGPNLPFGTAFDGLRDFSCNQPWGACPGGPVVQCTGDWAHTWPLYKTHPLAYAQLALEFFEAHPRRKGNGTGGAAAGNATALES